MPFDLRLQFGKRGRTKTVYGKRFWKNVLGRDLAEAELFCSAVNDRHGAYAGQELRSKLPSAKGGNPRRTGSIVPASATTTVRALCVADIRRRS